VSFKAAEHGTGRRYPIAFVARVVRYAWPDTVASGATQQGNSTYCANNVIDEVRCQHSVSRYVQRMFCSMMVRMAAQIGRLPLYFGARAAKEGGRAIW
jgi:hypothetical protein